MPGWRTRHDAGAGRAAELLDLVLDPDSFESWDTAGGPHRGVGVLPAPSCARPRRSPASTSRCSPGAAWSAADRSPSWSTSSASSPGSIGRAAAERIIAAVRRATAEGIPLLATTASGGTRMQEGTPAFVQMVEISRALMDHRAAGLPYLVYLRHPTTGGVFASWGSLGARHRGRAGGADRLPRAEGLRGAERR